MKVKFVLIILIASLATYSYITNGFFRNFLQGIGIVARDPVYPVQMTYQYPDLPNGCEVTSLTIFLNAMGYEVDKMDLYLNYLPKDKLVKIDGKYYGPSPENKYVGDARIVDEGWYCYEDVILEAADAFFTSKHTENRLVKVSAIDKRGLDIILKKQQPIMAWTTLDYSPVTKSNKIKWQTSNGNTYVPNSNQHCVIIYGASDRAYFIANPISGWETIDKDRFMTAFESVGSRAITVK